MGMCFSSNTKRKSRLIVIAKSKDEDQFMNIQDQNFNGNNTIQEDMTKFNRLYYKLPNSLNGIQKDDFFVVNYNKDVLQKRVIKLLEIGILEQEQTISKNQIMIHRQLDHPNAIKLYEVYKDEKFYYLVLDYCEGLSLTQAVQNKLITNQFQLHQIIKQMLQALNYLHSLEIIHRNVSLDNFRFVNQDISSDLKIVGLWQSVYNNQKFFKGSGIIKDLNFSAPEVLIDEYSYASDIWACGVMIYKLISGRFPFNGTTYQKLAKSIQRGMYNFNGGEWLEQPLKMRDFISQFLNYQPQTRITASKALQFSWFKVKPKQKQNNSYIFECVTPHKYRSKIKTCFIMYMIDNFVDNSQKKRLGEYFKQIDTDNDGKLSKDELIQGVMKAKNLDKIAGSILIHHMMLNFDIDQSGYLDFTEFLAASLDRKLFITEQNIKTTFNLIDMNKDGSISLIELSKFFNGCGLDSRQWKNLFLDGDENGDEKITLKELIYLMNEK